MKILQGYTFNKGLVPTFDFQWDILRILLVFYVLPEL